MKTYFLIIDPFTMPFLMKYFFFLIFSSYFSIKRNIAVLPKLGGGTIQEGGSDLSCIWWGVEGNNGENFKYTK